MMDDWYYFKKPTKAGWYATTYCWDPMEGVFVGANKWDGSNWEESLPVGGHFGPFESEELAQAWAEEHDPEAI
jgi:hypothetical protein